MRRGATAQSAGFTIVATAGTAKALERARIPAEVLKKVGEGSPHVVDAIRSKTIAMVVNTTLGRQRGARQLFAQAPDAPRQHPVLHDDVGGAGRCRRSRPNAKGATSRCAAFKNGTAESSWAALGADEVPRHAVLRGGRSWGASRPRTRDLSRLDLSRSGPTDCALLASRGRDAKVSARPALTRSQRTCGPTNAHPRRRPKGYSNWPAPRPCAASAPRPSARSKTMPPPAPSAGCSKKVSSRCTTWHAGRLGGWAQS